MQSGFKKFIAFTLAEVLITLGIIGVVAAMTIPTLMNSYQKNVYVTALKKAYATTNQALTQMAADAGCAGDLTCTGFFSSTNSNQTVGDAFAKYFKVLKNCGDYSTTSTLGCFSNDVNYNYDGSDPNSGWDHVNYRFVALDGTAYMFYSYADNCAVGTYSNHTTNNLNRVCGDLYIDVNGVKGPNFLGRDIFYFFITNGKGPLIYPIGGVDSALGHWADASGNPTSCYPSFPVGYNCAARIIEEGWQMNY